MFSVGALDAYFCDAYTDVIAATASSKSRQPGIVLPEWFYDIKFPMRAILEEYSNTNWRWRMAARKLMERENVISLKTIQGLFNKFFRQGHHFFGEVLHDWMSMPEARIRLFGIGPADYQELNSQGQHDARRVALNQFEERFKTIFQRRHDCIHNCDRPKISPQPLSASGTVIKVIQDIEFLIEQCDSHVNQEFRHSLVRAQCSAATIAQAGY